MSLPTKRRWLLSRSLRRPVGKMQGHRFTMWYAHSRFIWWKMYCTTLDRNILRTKKS